MRTENASIYTVTQVNSYIRNLIARDFALRQIYVKGEVSNCKYHQTGHIYFTLKDGTGVLPAVMFAGNRNGLRFRLQDGQKIIVLGQISMYEKTGAVQIYVKEIRLEGRGDLYQILEERKNRLAAMGMFAQEYKRPIPRYVHRVGIVTAPTGAAIRDIVNIAARRNPYVQLIQYPAIVQGEYAAPSIIRGIETLDAFGVDVIICGRGGGSIEDLWAFNEESVARAIFDCGTPVISAVGHETDWTIADLVADLRAPTPSAGAELAVYDIHSFYESLDKQRNRLGSAMTNRVNRENIRLMSRKTRLEKRNPGRILDEKRQGLLNREDQLQRILQESIRDHSLRVEDIRKRMERSMERSMNRSKNELEVYAARLDAMSPLKQLQKGFAFVRREDGSAFRSVSDVQVGDCLFVSTADGNVSTRVESIETLTKNLVTHEVTE